MTTGSITALVSGLSGLVVAVTGLIAAIKAHGRISAMQQQGSPAGQQSSGPRRP